MKVGICAVLVVTLAILPGLVFGQTTTPEGAKTIRIMGRVVDVTGLPLPGTTVTLTIVGSEKPETEILTDESGRFVFPSASPQSYDLRFDERGFTSRTIRVAEAETSIIDVGTVIMQIGEIFEGPLVLTSNRTQPNVVLSVCEALRKLNALNGKIVAVRGTFHFTRRHGGWILDERMNGDPCLRMPKRGRIWWSGIWLGSVKDPNLDGGPVHFEEESPSYGDLIKIVERSEHNGEKRNVTVTLIGEIRTRKNLKIVPAPSGRGDVMGNGYGVGGAYPAILIAKTTREIVSTDEERPAKPE